MTKIILTRHGHVEGIEPERFRGRAELPLSVRGMHEAKAVGRAVAANWKPVAVYSSPLGRCIATAAQIAKACALDYSAMSELADMHYGDWQGRLHSEMQSESPRLYSEWRRAPQFVRFPQGESIQDVAARTSDALRLVLERHPAHTVVLVGHDAVNRVLLTQLLDLPLSAFWCIAQQPCCINEIDVVEDSVRVLQINGVDHLASERARSE